MASEPEKVYVAGLSEDERRVLAETAHVEQAEAESCRNCHWDDFAEEHQNRVDVMQSILARDAETCKTHVVVPVELLEQARDCMQIESDHLREEDFKPDERLIGRLDSGVERLDAILADRAAQTEGDDA